MTSLVPASMSRDDAVVLTSRIRDSAEELWKLLYEAHERKAWQSLGYSTWASYVETEFDMSKRRANQLIAHAIIVSAIEAEVGTTVPTLTERQTRGLASDLPEIIVEIKDAVTEGADPQQAVFDAIEPAAVFEVVGGQSPEEIAQDFIRVVARTLEFHALDLANTENKADNAVSRLGRVLDWVARFADNDSTMVSMSRIVQQRYEEAKSTT